jgi:hypothetical protein
MIIPGQRGSEGLSLDREQKGLCEMTQIGKTGEWPLTN